MRMKAAVSGSPLRVVVFAMSASLLCSAFSRLILPGIPCTTGFWALSIPPLFRCLESYPWLLFLLYTVRDGVLEIEIGASPASISKMA